MHFGSQRDDSVFDQRQIILSVRACAFSSYAYRKRIAMSAPPSSATSRHDAISDVLHHVRPIEPSRFPRASLGTMTSRSPELLSRTVATCERWLTTMCINNSRTETYVNVSQSTIPFEASWLPFAINPTRPVVLSPIKSIMLGKIHHAERRNDSCIKHRDKSDGNICICLCQLVDLLHRFETRFFRKIDFMFYHLSE